MMLEAILTGLRLGAIILWAWLGLRVLFDSWTITGESAPVRQRGWRYFRFALLVMSAIVVFVFSPADILIANGYIVQAERQALSALGVIGLHASAIALHLGLDIANHQTRRATPVYLAISLATLLFGIAGHAA